MSSTCTSTLTHRPQPHTHPQHHLDPQSKVVKVAAKLVDPPALRKDVNRFSQLLLTLSIVSSFLYWTALVHPFSGYLHMGVKWFSILTLTAIVFRFLISRQDLFLFAALFCHSLGDLFLAHPYRDMLLYSLGPFLLGHIFYIMAFRADLPEYQKLKENLSRAKKALITASVIYLIMMSGILIPVLFNTVFAIPVTIYMVIVSLMVVLSVLPQYKSPLITLGCWMYIISDSLIAIDKFHTPLPYPFSSFTWPLYYIGQIMITLCLLREKGRDKDSYFFISHPRISF